MLPVSKDTLLRVVRKRALSIGTDTVNALGIDDFAWTRGQRCGTLLCDLQQRRICAGSESERNVTPSPGQNLQ